MTVKQKIDRADLTLAIWFSIIFLYVLIRSFIFHIPAPSWDDFLKRDALQTIFRIAAYVSLWIYTRHYWKKNKWGWGFKNGRICALGAALIFTAEALHFLSGAKWHEASAGWLLLGLLSTVVVAVGEEFAFRGVLFAALLRKVGMPLTVLLGSAFFSLFHIGVPTEIPPLYHLYLFLWGMVVSLLRAWGSNLGWLVLIHFVIDAIYVVAYPVYKSHESIARMTAVFGPDVLLMCIVVLLAALLKKREAADPISFDKFKQALVE